jgi:O-antigen/teichoic acid export membrane protein
MSPAPGQETLTSRTPGRNPELDGEGLKFMLIATTHPASPDPATGPARVPRVVCKPCRPKPPDLRINLLWTLTGNVVYAASQWGMLILLAKLSGPETVGQFALGLAITAPVFMLTNLQLRAVQATDARRAFLPGDYLALRLITTAVAGIAVTGVVLGGGFRARTALVVMAVALAKAIESVSDIFYGLLQQHERMDRIAVSMILKGVVSLAALGLAIALTGRMVLAVLALAAAWAAVLVAYDLPQSAALLRAACPGAGRPRPRWSRPHLLRLTWLALPLGIVMMLISLSASVPRYFVEAKLGERALGVFSAMAYLMVVGNTAVFALGQAASPRLARYFAMGQLAAFRALLHRLVGLAFAGGCAAVAVALVWGGAILQTLYTAEYARRTDVFVWLTIAMALGAAGSFLGYGMTSARSFRAQAPLFAFVVLATALSSALLVPRYGLLGAALATTVGQVVQLVGSAWVVRSILRRAQEAL